MNQYVPNVGQPPATDAARDAIHVPVCPLVAAVDMEAGDWFGLHEDLTAFPVGSTYHGAVGIVDPFRKGDLRKVKAGDQFWAFVPPGVVTGLRHVWSYGPFRPKPPVPRSTL
jgi:hypothetical protein